MVPLGVSISYDLGAVSSRMVPRSFLSGIHTKSPGSAGDRYLEPCDDDHKSFFVPVFKKKYISLYSICCNDSFRQEFCCIKETIQNHVNSRDKSRVFESVQRDCTSVVFNAKYVLAKMAFFSCLMIDCLCMAQIYVFMW